MNQAHRGWDSSFDYFRATSKSLILSQLRNRYSDASESEQKSWNRTVPTLQQEIDEVIQVDLGAAQFTAILEYQLPMELRRADVVLLLHDNVVVIELKGKSHSTDADIDQTHAYARDLRCYHRDCHDREITPILVPQLSYNHISEHRNVTICSPDRLDELVLKLSTRSQSQPIDAERFLHSDAYKPLPSLVKAARELFNNKKPPQLWRSVANTDQAVVAVRNIIAEAQIKKKRKLVLLMGVPGAGKTLVGLRIAHEKDLENIKAYDKGPPAVFLSGNGPLVEVLQYILKTGQGTGSVFVRSVMKYVEHYRRHANLSPNEHVMIFDEAQRAHDRDQVKSVHKIEGEDARSEPDYFIEFANRVPEWSVVVGLIGEGQEINVGEEGGLDLWVEAIANSSSSKDWEIHGPKTTAATFASLNYQVDDNLSLDENIRAHFASHLHDFVSQVVAKRPESNLLRNRATVLIDQGHDLRITRNLATAKNYLKERYANSPESRYGLIASSRDKFLESLGVPNGYHATKYTKVGPWYNDDEGQADQLSCRHLDICITEYEAQGLELDAVLMAWGTDFMLINGEWNINKARKYAKSKKVKNPFQLRANAYRVLLTRGRDAHVVFVPSLGDLDETWEFLLNSGFRELID